MKLIPKTNLTTEARWSFPEALEADIFADDLITQAMQISHLVSVLGVIIESLPESSQLTILENAFPRWASETEAEWSPKSDRPTCSFCSGSGEGPHEGGSCPMCYGRGTVDY